jgi:tetratricopeptide (TPR) repeat protein
MVDMDIIKKGSRIKYYRNLLGITRKELAGNCFSIPLIRSIEANKRGVTVTTATIILNNLYEAAKKKGLPLTIQLKELLMSDIDYARHFCLRDLSDNNGFDLSNYLLLISIAQDYSLDDVIMNIYEKLTIHYYTNKKYTETIMYLQKQYELSIKKTDYPQQVNILCRIGTCYYMIGDYSNSVIFYSKSYELFKVNNIENVPLIIKILHNLALNYAALEKFDEALVHIDTLLETKDIDENQLTTALILKTSILIDLQRYEDALLICEDLIKRNLDNIYIVQNNIGFVLNKLGRFDDSIRYFTDSINNQLKTPGSKTTLSLMSIAEVYKKDSNFKTSIIFYEYAIKNAIDFNQPSEVISCVLSLYDIYKFISKLDYFYLYVYKVLKQCKNQASDTIIVEKLEALINKLVI